MEYFVCKLHSLARGRLARDLIDYLNMKSKNRQMIERAFIRDIDLAERFDRVLENTVEAMEKAKIRYVFIGGIASGGLGRPRSTHDIDLFVMPEEADLAIKALEEHGFRVEKTDPTWLYKGFKDDILVDVIFKSKGEIYLDTEMYQKIITAPFHGKQLRLVSPEDLLIIKAAAHSEMTPNHWHDAIALLSYANIDWQYLIKRARRAPRRILSLLLYAQSIDIWVPNSAIHELYSGIFENHTRQNSNVVAMKPPLPPTSDASAKSNLVEKISKHKVQEYTAAHLRERLAEDPRTNELDIQVDQQGETLLLRGEVLSKERRDAAEQIAKEFCPKCTIANQIRILECHAPSESEEIK
jgi:predicted nucleotidyltransferase